MRVWGKAGPLRACSTEIFASIQNRRALFVAAFLHEQGEQSLAIAGLVIAGPYKNRKEVMKAAKRVLMDFELKAEAISRRDCAAVST